MSELIGPAESGPRRRETDKGIPSRSLLVPSTSAGPAGIVPVAGRRQEDIEIRAELERLRLQVQQTAATQAENSRLKAALGGDAYLRQQHLAEQRTNRRRGLLTVAVILLAIALLTLPRRYYPVVVPGPSESVGSTGPGSVRNLFRRRPSPSQDVVAALDRLDRALLQLRGSPEEIIKQVHFQNAENGNPACSFEFSPSGVSLVFGTGESVDPPVAIGHCAEAVEKAAADRQKVNFMPN